MDLNFYMSSQTPVLPSVVSKIAHGTAALATVAAYCFRVKISHIYNTDVTEVLVNLVVIICKMQDEITAGEGITLLQ